MLEYRSSQAFVRKVRNFPEEVYRVDDESTHLFKYMFTLLQLGLGQLIGWQDEANNSESMPGTSFNDLDAFFAFLGVVRSNYELYPYDPFHQQLTFEQWSDVISKDALFRLRIVKFFKALQRGGTPEGIKMAAEAACGVECQVFEMWRVYTGQGLAAVSTLGRSALFKLGKEFVILPLEEISGEQRAAIIHLVDVLKPANTICTVHDSPSTPLEEVLIQNSASEDYWFEVRRMVSASDDLVFEDPDVWIQPNEEVEGPTFAYMNTSTANFSLNESVDSMHAFQIDEQFMVTFGTIDDVGGISSSDTTFVVDEVDAPTSPSFPIKIDDEQMYVIGRVPVPGEDTKFTYTVTRGYNGTTPATHIDTSPVDNGTITLLNEVEYNAQFGPWTVIPLADAPDNYPEGKYPGNPAKFDSDGQYLFDYDSQNQYEVFFSQQIQLMGGEVADGRYRLPIGLTSQVGQITTPLDALAAPELDIQPRIFPAVRS